jgi:hypothetical protein
MKLNNDDASLQYPVLLLKIPMDMQNNLSENYQQSGQMLSKRFTRHGIG